MAQPKVVRLEQFRQFDQRRPVSKLLHESDNSRVVLFCLEAGQELPAHESTSEVLFYGVAGRPAIIIGKDRVTLDPEAFVACPPNVPHGISATQRAVVLAIIAPRPA